MLTIAVLNTDQLVTVQQDAVHRYLHGTLEAGISRNLRISSDHIFDTNREDGFWDNTTLRIQASMTYPLRRVSRYSIFKDMESFVSIVYEREFMNTVYSLNKECWSGRFVGCFSDLSVGISKPLFSKHRFSGKFSFYFDIPLSKISFQQSLILGTGMMLSTKYLAFSNARVQLYTFSSHILGVNAHAYRTSDLSSTRYNVPLFTFHQLGGGLDQQARHSLIPNVIVSGGYNLAVNWFGTIFHNLSVNMLGTWLIGDRYNILVGFKWGDRFLKPKNTALAQKTVFFNPDNTILHAGGRYIL